MPDYQLQVSGGQLDKLNHQQPGENVLINGDKRVNQRDFDGDWSGLSDGDYGYDRWKKSGSNMVQVVEAGNFVSSTVYTLSGDAVAATQITSPASGDWTVTVSQSADNIKLEYGEYATAFNPPLMSASLADCQRYYEAGIWSGDATTYQSSTDARFYGCFKAVKRAAPSVTVTAGGGGGGVSSTTADLLGIRVQADSGTAFTFTFTADSEL